VSRFSKDRRGLQKKEIFQRHSKDAERSQSRPQSADRTSSRHRIFRTREWSVCASRVSDPLRLSSTTVDGFASRQDAERSQVVDPTHEGPRSLLCPLRDPNNLQAFCKRRLLYIDDANRCVQLRAESFRDCFRCADAPMCDAIRARRCKMDEKKRHKSNTKAHEHATVALPPPCTECSSWLALVAHERHYSPTPHSS